MKHLRVAMLALFVLGCRDATAPSSDQVYRLQMVNEKSLPTSVGVFTVLAGDILLRADSTFRDRVSYTYAGAQLTDSLDGVYGIRGDSLIFWAPTAGYRYSAAFNGTRIVVTAWGFREEYQR